MSYGGSIGAREMTKGINCVICKQLIADSDETIEMQDVFTIHKECEEEYWNAYDDWVMEGLAE